MGIKNLILYKTRDNYTLNHEALHGLSLNHTHKDNPPTIEKERKNEKTRKYIYPNALSAPANATDNIMSYQSDGKTTWKWQWEFMRKNV